MFFSCLFTNMLFDKPEVDIFAFQDKMPAPGMSFKKLRRQLDDLGYYQPLVPESLPLAEALLHDLLATTHNLKLCKEQKSGFSKIHHVDEKKSKSDEKNEEFLESEQVLNLTRKVTDLDLLYKESIKIIQNLQCEIEERNKKILKLELSQKAQVLTQKESRLKPRIEMTSLVENQPSTSSSGPTYDSVHNTPKMQQNQIDVIAIYTQKNKSLESDVKRLQNELKSAKEMLGNVENYWSQQV